MLKRIAYRILNIPLVWIIFQHFVGANRWKKTMYPSVFRSRGALLDFGSSMGNTTQDFLDFDYTGIDTDPSMIDAATKRWAGYENVRFVCADILTKPFPDASFDHVLFACTGHHLTDEEMKKIIPALLATLRPGGELHFFDVIKQPGKDGFTTRLIMNNDQGKHMRLREEYDALFAPYTVSEKKLFPSPDGNIVKLQDMLYFRVAKPVS